MGFTLVEVLVVIAIISLLIGLLLPAVQAAREASRRVFCANRMKQIGLAIHNYHSAYQQVPRGAWVEIPPRPFNGGTWCIEILPFLELGDVFEKIDSSVLGVDQLSSSKVSILQKPLAAFVCPSSPGEPSQRKYQFNATSAGFPFTATDLAICDYSPTTGVRGAYANFALGPQLGGDREGVLPAIGVLFGNQVDESFAGILDGLSNTTVMGERTGGAVIYNHGIENPTATNALGSLNGGGWGDLLNGDMWLEGAPPAGVTIPSSGGSCAINCTNARGHGFHSFHPGGCHFLFADGAVKFVGPEVNPVVFAAAITRRGRERLAESL